MAMVGDFVRWRCCAALYSSTVPVRPGSGADYTGYIAVRLVSKGSTRPRVWSKMPRVAEVCQKRICNRYTTTI